MLLLRAVLFTVLVSLSVMLWSIVVVIGRLWGDRVSYSLVIAWIRGVFWLLQKLCGLNYRVEGRRRDSWPVLCRAL